VAGSFELSELSERAVAPDPIVQFHAWYSDARTAMGDAADAVVVATADATGAPSARVVLLRGVDERGFCFFTNYESRKGDELRVNARAALVWHWPALHRQVRVTGEVERVSAEESDAYWVNRPLASRLSASASQQSAVIGSRAELEAAVADLEARVAGVDLERPDFWGGYRVIPGEVEFWLHRDDRLHDRVRYRRSSAGDGVTWAIERLQP
jgi:pyridoxamine 5'-phosphate oxidase